MQLTISREDLAPLLREVVAEMLDQFGGDPARIAYGEKEAAALLGLEQHQLRDARLRGEIVGAKLGRSFHYTRAELIAYLQKRKSKD